MEEESAVIPSVQVESVLPPNKIERKSGQAENPYIFEVNPINISSVFQAIKEASSGSRWQIFFKIFSPILFIVWWFPIVLIGRIFRNINNQLSTKSNHQSDFIIRGPETLWTAVNPAFKGITSLRFFGIRFLAIWGFPLIVTGTVMEVLFVSPLRGVSPFN